MDKETKLFQNIILIIIFIIGLICAFISVLPAKEEHQVITTNIQSQQYEKLIKEAQDGGLIKGFESAYKGETSNVYNCVVDEQIWNELPFEAKKNMVTLMQRYGNSKGIKILSFKGYKSGKKIIVALSNLKNF